MQRRVTFGAVKARLYDAPGATKVTVAGEGRETLAPSSANFIAVVSPIPEPDPVTITVLFKNLLFIIKYKYLTI